mgnify:CR=1 FL=1
MDRVAIVCDSTCDLGPEWLASNEVRMVPLKVLFGTDSFLDWVDLTPELFYEKLGASAVLPKTSQPSPADFAAVYAELADAGFSEIVSIHLTSALSGTFESATMAAADSAVPVRIVDTKTVSLATGLAIQAAVRTRDAGGDAASVEQAARTAAESSRLFFVLDTLEYLVKGGRAGKASGLAASVLNIKPILTFTSEGTIEPYKKIKGLKKAMAELVSRVAEDSAEKPVRLSVIHGAAPDLADQLLADLQASEARYTLETVSSIGAVIGTYGGPGAIGVAYHPEM